MHTTLRHKQQIHSAEVRRQGDRFHITLADGTTREVQAVPSSEGHLRLIVDGRSHSLAITRVGRDRYVAVAGETYCFTPESSAHAGHSVGAVASPEVVAPMPGKILEVLVGVGDRVEAGQGLVILEAMKMETRLSAEASGVVAEVRVTGGATIDGGAVLIVLQFDA